MVMDMLSRSLGRAARYLHRGRRLLWANDSLIVFEITAPDVRPQAPRLDAGVPWAVDERELRGIDEAAAAAFPSALRASVPHFAPEDRLHTVTVDGELAAWGFSAFPSARWPLTETGTTLDMPPASGCLTAFETLPQYRGRRLYPTLLTSMLTGLFGRGASRAFIWCHPENGASRSAIARVGFRPIAVHSRRSVLGVSRSRAGAVVGHLSGS
jgi:hypothetical protein